MNLQKSNDVLSIRFESLITKLNKTIDRRWAHQTLFISDFNDCSQLLQNFIEMDKYFIEHPFHWLIFLKKEQMAIFNTISISIGSNIVLALHDQGNNEFKLVQGNVEYLTYFKTIFQALHNFRCFSLQSSGQIK